MTNFVIQCETKDMLGFKFWFFFNLPNFLRGFWQNIFIVILYIYALTGKKIEHNFI